MISNTKCLVIKPKLHKRLESFKIEKFWRGIFLLPQLFLRLKSSRHNRLVYNYSCIFYYLKLLLNLIQDCTRHFKILMNMQYTSPWLNTKILIVITLPCRHKLFSQWTRADAFCLTKWALFEDQAKDTWEWKSLTSRKRTVFNRGHEFKTVAFVQNVASGSCTMSMHEVSS